MGKAEITVFIILINIILLIFIIGIIVFIFQYRKRKLHHQQEKAAIEKQHRLDLLNNQLQIQQQTMQFIGSEIHDSVTQKLTLASLYSQKLEFENRRPDILGQLGKISNIINDSLCELRSLAKTLTNADIQNEKLIDLLNHECEKVNDTGIYRMQVISDFEREMSITVKSFLLRVIQEFIQNSLKHSGCTLIKVSLFDKGDGLFITLSDNGKGFDIGKLHTGGIGLSNMRRRLRLVGGEFDLQSKPENGTTLQLFIKNKNLLPE